MIVEKIINTIDWNNGFYTISKTELKDIITKVSDIQYGRGKIHGLCHRCEYLEEELYLGDKTSDDICGNLAQCKSCTKSEYVEYFKNFYSLHKK